MPQDPRESHFAPFPKTRWSIIIEAGGGETASSRRALEEICQSYWLPLYAFIRRSGFGREDAEDLTQSFLARLLEKDVLAGVGEEKGKLRTFLLVSMKNFLRDFRRREGAQKRGGGKTIVSIDREFAESQVQVELADATTPESLFAEQWALTIIDSVFELLGAEYAGAGKATLFDALCPLLQWNASPAQSYAEFGKQLGMTEGAVKVAAYRLRKRYRALFRERIMETVASEEELEEEIQFFFKTFQSG